MTHGANSAAERARSAFPDAVAPPAVLRVPGSRPRGRPCRFSLTSRNSCSTRGCSASRSGPWPAAPRSSSAASRPCSSAVLAPSSRHTATAVSESSRHSAEVAVPTAPAAPLPLPALIAPRSAPLRGVPLGCRPPPAAGASSAAPCAPREWGRSCGAAALLRSPRQPGS